MQEILPYWQLRGHMFPLHWHTSQLPCFAPVCYCILTVWLVTEVIFNCPVSSKIFGTVVKVSCCLFSIYYDLQSPKEVPVMCEYPEGTAELFNGSSHVCSIAVNCWIFFPPQLTSNKQLSIEAAQWTIQFPRMEKSRAQVIPPPISSSTCQTPFKLFKHQQVIKSGIMYPLLSTFTLDVLPVCWMWL